MEPATTDPGNVIPTPHLPIIMCIGMVEYTDDEYSCKVETMDQPLHIKPGATIKSPAVNNRTYNKS